MGNTQRIHMARNRHGRMSALRTASRIVRVAFVIPVPRIDRFSVLVA